MDPVTVLLSIVIILFLAKVYNDQKQDKNYPPGPKPLPIIGSLHLVNPVSPQKDFMKVLFKYLHSGHPEFAVLNPEDKTSIFTSYGGDLRFNGGHF